MAFDEEQERKYLEALDAGCDRIEATAYAGAHKNDYLEYLGRHPTHEQEARDRALRTVAKSKVKIARLVSDEVPGQEIDFDQHLKYMAIKQPKEWSPKAVVELNVNRPMVQLPGAGAGVIDVTADEPTQD